MAGSPSVPPPRSIKDPILAARIEALQLLAAQISEHVMVLGPDLTILYANQAVWKSAPHRAGDGEPKCYETFSSDPEACRTCPATEVFQTETIRSASSDEEARACGIHQALPLQASEGRTQSVLVLLKPLSLPRNGAPGSAATADQVGSDRLGELIGRSVAMRRLFEMLRLVADSQATVLVQGESGTGKELVAKTVHRLSPRRDRPFIVVDCGALPETLLESELFGHVKGAFTGAIAGKEGLFEAANGGTLFLDEIADTSPQFQAKLLRVLQEGEVKPVGSTRSVKVDVRVISATNKDLFDLVKARAFREDLYYRLAVLPIALPALRERADDIPLLVRHFVESACIRHRRPLKEVTDEALHRLMEAPWPGNIRQLQHVVERAIVTSTEPRLTAADFFGASVSDVAETDLPSITRQAVRSAERARILEALRHADGNRVKAARLLNISRASLYNKLKAYGIEPSSF
ncbi:sigma-54 interaction domain-containing protein [Candidatus Nitrospira bockiana]